METIKNVISIVLCIVPLLSISQQSINKPDAQQMLNKTNQNFFIENKGQWPKEVRYLARISGMNAWITDAGVVYDYYRKYRNVKTEEVRNLPPDKKEEYENKYIHIKGQVVNIFSEGANIRAKAIPSGIQDGYYSYFIGNDKSKWASFVRLYNEVLIQDIYPGISIRYYFDNGMIRYDYIAKPGANLSQINLRVTGSDGYNINNEGELTLETSVGTIFHGKLYAYQQPADIKEEVRCSFTKNKNGTIGIFSENYNPALALVIDPLIYSTFLGGSDNDKGTSIAVDISGFAYVTGYSEGTNFPTVTGAYDRSQNGYSDIIVTKLSTTGSGLEYSTFIGGNAGESATNISIDTNGNAYITGYTESTNFPTTSLAYETVNKGGSDVFVTILNYTGSMLDYSSYIGGSGDDRGNSIVVDSIGNIYIAGFTESNNYPTTSTSYDVSHNGYGDVFVTKFDPFFGYILAYSTFIGGSGYDNANSMTIDVNGNVYLTGYTESSNYPTKFGSYDRSYNGVRDAFVTKLDAGGSNLVYSTFIGGGSYDNGTSIALDNAGNTYITGYTESSAYPVTSGVFDVSYNGYNDVFVTKLNASGSALVYSTFIGGSDDDYCNSIFLDKTGNVYLTGATSSTNYPVTSGTYDALYNGLGDIFISKLNNTGSILSYSTFIGGSDDESAASITLDYNGNAYLTGATTSFNYPTTASAYDRTRDLEYDLFVTKILPINQAKAISVTNITSSGANCNWTKGSGIKRAVFVIKSDTGIASPVDFTSYTGSKTFGSGTQIGSSGWYCVYNDTGASVVISGLLAKTTYRVMICEYIGITGYEIYNTDFFSSNPVNFSTPDVTPSLQAKNLTFSNISDAGFTINCTTGNGSKRVIFVKSNSYNNTVPQNNTSYTANTIFGSGTQISASGWYCVYNDTGNTVTINNLTPNTTYQVFACEYNGAAGKEQYNTDTAAGNPSVQITKYKSPDIQAGNIIVTAYTSSSFTVKWTKGNGSTRTVFVTQGITGTPLPLNNFTYKANDSFSLGTQIGSSGWYCVYNDTGNIVRIKNLLSNTIFRVFVCEYNGTAGKEQYNTDTAIGNPVNQMTSYPTPTVQANKLTFSNVFSNRFTAKWTNGNGTNRLVFITDNNPGTANPLNNYSYNANDTFSFGTQIGSSGWYCVYNGIGDSVVIRGLSPLTTYKVMICEYNGLAGLEQYLTSASTNNPSNQTTDFAKPSIQASNIIFSNITATNAIYNYDRGNGTACIILVTEGTTPYPPLIDNTNYPVSSQIGTSGWYCKYNGSLNPTSLGGLHPATWRLMICEYNGSAGSEKYNTDTAKNNPNSFTNVGINDQLAQKIKIYPNPSNGQLFIDNATGNNFQIYNSLGNVIYSGIVNDAIYCVDLKDETDGIYILKLECEGKFLNRMFILKR